ncbi:MAG: XRE family transcriptional regulator [Gammaproteobacteria bacterium]|nr:XRE family transcriptional regulator [Gammaproteobacteria bacterium]
MTRDEFSGVRLRTARRIQGLTQLALAKRMAVTPTTVWRYEHGLSAPAGEILEALCDVLDVHENYFYGPALVEFSKDDIAYRSLATIPGRIRQQLSAFGTLSVEWIRFLRQQVAMPSLDVPSVVASTQDDIETAAARCRKHWYLGQGPIHSITRVLENAGIVVSSIDTEAREVDALSVCFDDQGLVVLNRTRGSSSRAIQSCAHELGHMVLHQGDKSKTPKTKEREAKHFAGAFLLPKQTFRREFWGYIQSGDRFDGLVTMKRRWRVSIQSILYRARQLQLLGPASFRRYMQIVSSRGWRSGVPEPAEPEPLAPELLNLAFNQYQAKTGQAPSAMAAHLGWGTAILATIAGKSVEVDRRRVVDITTQMARKRKP